MRNLTKSSETSGVPDYARQLELYQKKIANILESFTDAFFEVDRNWTVLYWNKEAERMLGVARQDVVGKNLWTVYADAVPLKFFSEYHRAMNENVAVRFEEYFEPLQSWYEVAAFPSGESLSVYFKDITSRKLAEQQVELERQKYHDLFNFSPLPQWVYDLETLAFLQVNEAAIFKYGYSREEFSRMTIRDIRPVEEQVVLDQIINTEIVQTGHHNLCIVKHRKKNGEIIFVEVEGNTVFFEGRKARLVMALDLTEKIKAQKELEISLNRYDIVSKATSDAIWDWDLESGKITWNKGICGIFGYEDTSFDSTWVEANVHPDDLRRVRKQFRGLIRNKKSRQQIEYRFRCANGSYKTVLDRSFILFDEHGKAIRIIGSMQDITERIQVMHAMEDQNKRLREISWIQSHKVRAPLARIMGLAELISIEDTSNRKEIKELVKIIYISANDLDGVVKEITEKSQLR